MTARDMINREDQMSMDQANGMVHPTRTTEDEYSERDIRTITTEDATHIISCKEEHQNHAENPMR